MLAITDAAGVRLAELIYERDLGQDIAIRVVKSGRGVAMQRDTRRNGDAILEHQGRTILLLGQDISEFLTDKVLDVDGTDFAIRLADEVVSRE